MIPIYQAKVIDNQTNIQLPQITLDKLLQLEVGEEARIIIPIYLDIEKNEDLYKVSTILLDGKFTIVTEQVLIEKESPIQPNEEFYTSEELVWCKDCKEVIYDYNYYIEPKCPKCGNDFITDKGFQDASQMTPEQSRFQGVCVDVKVKRIGELYAEYQEYNQHKTYYKIVPQHNKLHSCNIEPSLDDYVFYITIRRTK